MRKPRLFFKKFYLAIIMLFLYIPIVVMIAQSFNAGKSRAKWEGFSFRWYAELFQDRSIMQALQVTIAVAVIAAVIATILGTLAAIGIYSMKRRPQSVMMTLTNIPMTNPDIVTGVSLSLLFVFVGTRMLGQRNSLTFWTLLIAHITFNLPYVILNVMPKLKQTDSSLRDAAMDLGCTPLQAFFKVTLHEIAPGIVSGAIMAFTMSLDDFVISYFVSGLDFVTLPVEIYSYTKKPLHPKIYALFTLLFLLILVLMVTMNLIQLRGDRKRAAAHSGT